MKTQVPLYLNTEDRAHLEQMIRSGREGARTLNRARILLLSDRSMGEFRLDEEVAQALLCSLGTVRNVRRRLLTEGMQAALYDKPRPGRAPKITGDIEAQITLIACSDPPEGCAGWTVRLLADRVVELGVLEQVHHTTIWERLKKTRSSPGK